MQKGIDFEQRKFGRLQPISHAFVRVTPNGSRKHYWLCRCDCGQETVASAGGLTSGRTQSCGCLRRELVAAKNRRHGLAKSAEYEAWCGMKRRCASSHRQDFKNYGARGIEVCSRWLESFEAFIADMGPKPGPSFSIERIDNDGIYEPGNCRWATKQEQLNNQRKNVHLTLNGTTRTAAEWGRLLKIKSSIILDRKRSGWSDERALTQPVRRWPSRD